MARWYDLHPERLKGEEGLLNEAGFHLDREALRLRTRVEFVGVINDSKADVPIRIICPEGFPYRIPTFVAPDLKLNPETRHISFRTHSICLRLTVPNGWDFEDHVVDLIDDARRVLVGQHTNDFGGEHLAPDRDLFGSQSAETRIVMPDDLNSLPAENATRAELARLDGTHGSTLVLTNVGDRKTAIELKTSPGSLQVELFRLSQIPLEFIRELDDTFGIPQSIDIWRMLRQYALEPRTVEHLFKRLPKNVRRTFCIGIVFPFQQNEIVWQFFKFTVHHGAARTEVLATYQLKDLNVRISPSLDLAALKKAKALVVGAGAIGSTMAVELACAGIGHIEICDFDRISIGNIPRHQASLSALGQLKVEAVRDLINAKNPSTKVTTIPKYVFEDAEFEDRVRTASIVAVSVGDDNTERYINDICVRMGTPAIYAYVGMHSSVGHVVRTIPKNRETGCLECFSRIYHTENSVIPRLPEPADPNEVVVELGCNNPSLPGAGFDIKTVALTAVRKAIQTILRPTYSYPDDRADIIVLATRALEKTPYYSLFAERFELPSNPNCSTCGRSANLDFSSQRESLQELPTNAKSSQVWKRAAS